MSNLVPEGWAISNINRTCDILDSKRVPLNSQERALRKGDYPYYGANGIQGHIDDYIFEGEHVLLAEDGGNFDQWQSRPISYLVSGKFWVNNHAHILKAKQEHETQFIHYSLVHKNILKHINGGTRAKLNQADMRDITILMPPLPEQQKIAKILTSVDEVIEKTQAQIDKLKDLKTGMMQELLTNGIGHTEFKDSPVGRIPAEWEVKTVESILSVIIDYRGKAPPKSEVGVPLITAKNIRNGFINQEPREYIYEEQFNSWMVRGMPQFGDVFITTEAPLGNVAKVPNYKFAIGQRVLTLRPNELVCTEFLLFILQSEKFKKELDLQSTGSTVAGIKQSTFRKILLPVPSIDEQIKISESLNSVVRRSDVIKDKLQSFKSLKKALMQDLLTGKVRVKVS
ncbi:restriction endonuclease subunit S [Pseudoalteromonas sp. SG44-8]|uniref:restriction endonuclease subunit S n=1 Tax=Pseudoalteromonas sp. SG44-8 TaxID=2760958 RepID=UPI0015FF899C|nr:restriction endonuclease subunit S [Pseudoalteromonas sp. SG44-8]MBB1398087.1 restriction endonuclease subunit S [Pseudoalteromonas sp. SG44-8]